MISKKQILEDIQYSEAFQTIAESYEEIAASRMQRIRNSVIASRDFLLGINNIFQQVKSSYKLLPAFQGEALQPQKSQKRKNLKKIFRKTNGKTLFILMSANTGLYGDIIRRTFEAFAREVKRSLAKPDLASRDKTDTAVVGRLGIKLFQEQFPKKPFLFFDLSDNRIDHMGIKTILSQIIFYEKIIVFYQQFQNILHSTPMATSVSGDTLSGEWEGRERIKYVFEPSLERVMEYFEQEIISAIFQQIVYESLLAKFASRMVALEETTETIQNQVKKLILRKEMIRHQELNKKQNERLGSMSLWR